MGSALLTKADIEKYLKELNLALQTKGAKGEICLYGGAVLCVVYEARPATKDIDAVFRPTQEIRAAIDEIAQAHNLPEDWLNDAVKGFVVEHPQRILFNFSNLQVYVPEPDYLLAMKTLAARVDTQDKGDIIFLIKQLGLKTPDEVFKILENYYPRQIIKPATQFFVEELFESDDLA
jgi:hypothetical protein